MTKLDIAGYILTGICGVITAAYGVWIAAYAVTEYIDNK